MSLPHLLKIIEVFLIANWYDQSMYNLFLYHNRNEQDPHQTGSPMCIKILIIKYKNIKNIKISKILIKIIWKIISTYIWTITQNNSW